MTKDGVTVAKEVELKDRFANMGAQMVKEVASKTNEQAGDGTTTATVLAQAIINVGLKNVTAGASPMDLKKGIDKAVAAVVAELRAHSQEVGEDYSKIEQVLYNLIDNAIKFSEKDSSIYISTLCKSRKVFVSVKDTGIGIPKDSIKKIWDRFYKTDISRGRDKTGTGLGLSIVREIIQAHNETIDVISTEGVGTEFVFSLPMSEEETDR